MRLAGTIRARRRGAETLKFLLTAMVMMIITVGCVLITNAYGNALATQHALSQTALYVAANGRYTVALERECERMLPTSGNEFHLPRRARPERAGGWAAHPGAELDRRRADAVRSAPARERHLRPAVV